MSQISLEGNITSNLNLLANILDLNDKTGVNKSGQTYSERIEDTFDNK